MTANIEGEARKVNVPSEKRADTATGIHITFRRKHPKSAASLLRTCYVSISERMPRVILRLIGPFNRLDQTFDFSVSRNANLERCLEIAISAFAWHIPNCKDGTYLNNAMVIIRQPGLNAFWHLPESPITNAAAAAQAIPEGEMAKNAPRLVCVCV